MWITSEDAPRELAYVLLVVEATERNKSFPDVMEVVPCVYKKGIFISMDERRMKYPNQSWKIVKWQYFPEI